MLRLKSLELHGYKTFASRTPFGFADGITAIVGPNGSGKSNIADSLRWVLGEQSHNLLRAKKTEDMIFAGSEQRPRSGMASVTITFDNTTGWLPVDFSEVAVTRRAYRDGRNEYLLNGQTVRLKDVNELLAQSGLSERTYTILGQGMVDASLALKADERRRLFEEAAGIGLYRARREESLRRLENTQRNLERVLDILAELEPRLRLLERQAKRAQEYAQVKADLHLVLREWYGYHWHRLQKELGEAHEMARQQEAKLNDARTHYHNLTGGFSATRARLSELRTQLNEWHRSSATLHQQRETVSRELAVLEERRRALTETRQGSLAEQERLADEERAARERVAEAQAEFERIQAEAADAKTQENDAKVALTARQLERAQVEQKVNTARQNLNTLNSRRAQHQAHLNELETRLGTQRQKLQSADLAIATIDESFKTAGKKAQGAQKTASEAESALRQAEADLTALRQRLGELESTRRQRQDERNAKQGEQTRLQAQLDVLEQAENSLSGYADGARYLLEAARQSKLSSALALSTALDVPAEYETAIAAALGDAFDVVLVESAQGVDQALELLEQAAGRAVILDRGQASTVHPDDAGAGRPPSTVEGKWANDLVKVKAELIPAVDLLLGDVLVVEDRAAARRLRTQAPTLRLVTLKGEVFRPDGLIHAGREARAAALSRPRQRRELGEQLASVAAEFNNLTETLTGLNAEITGTQKEIAQREATVRDLRSALNAANTAAQQATLALESARRQRDWQAGQKETLAKELAASERDRTETELTLEEIEAKLGEAQEALRKLNGEMAALSLDELSTQVTYWGARVAVSQRTVNDGRVRNDERRQTLERVLAQTQAAARRVEEIAVSLEQLEAAKATFHTREDELQEQIEALQAQIDPAEGQLDEAEKQEVSLQEQEAAAQRALSLVERYNAQAQIDLSRKQEALENLRRRVEEDFGLVQFEYATDISGPVPLPLDGMVELLPMVTELASDLEENLSQKRAQLRRMGAVNMEAQQEYESVQERYSFMTTQVEDLKKAESDLREVIAELDEVTRRDFHKTFEAVATEFKAIFTRLFGGGSARLVLTDPDNLTETGIDIEARLPGRREQGLSLLSGGERSLTAISLVFALLKISPTPLCVMDEVDAMLDEANVGRFRDLLSELGQTTQFIVITHNRNTVQVADAIYGITMGRDSASQVISLRLDEVSDEMLGRSSA